jgi:hypothetical protein
MRTLDNDPYRGITPEELHVVIRRAHAERAQAMREMFSALRLWLGRLGRRLHAASPALPTATGR